MPIKLQRRHTELGRIRLGSKNPKGFPMKLDRFRFTSVSEGYIRDLATLYGGTPQPWDNHGIASWEVFTDAAEIPVIAVKGGLSQWLEFWSGGGCLHRCDGETNVLTGEPCDLDEQVKVGRKTVNPHAEAKPTTRLSMMLRELEAIGVWRMESHGWNAAAEIPAVAELAQFVGDLVPALLRLQERRVVRDGETSRFVVPVLDLQIGAARLREVVEAKMLPTAAPAEMPQATAAAAIAAPAVPDYRGAAEKLTDLDQVRALWQQAAAAGHLDDDLRAFLTERGKALQAAASGGAQQAGEATGTAATASPAVPDGEGVYEAEIITADPDPDAAWGQIMQLAASRGLGTSADLEDDVALFLGGTTAGEASGAELAEYLEDLRKRPEVAA